MWRILTCLLFLLIGSIQVFGCAWDIDTLKFELKGLPGIQDAVSGRFERPPDKYYEIRLERLKLKPESDWSLGEFDDAAVACDKLNRHADAIDLMVKKKIALSKLKLDEKARAEAEYRLYANRGTFYAHMGLAANGEDFRKNVQRGIDDLKLAVEINPDAHFGREWVQIAVLMELLEPNSDLFEEFLQTDEDRKAFREGVLGIMAIGNGWNSIDMFHLLKISLDLDAGQTAHLIDLRISELESEGQRSRFEDAFLNRFTFSYMLEDKFKESNLKNFGEMRKNGDEFRAHYTDFVSQKLSMGQHPDTDKDFFDDYVPVPPFRVSTSLENPQENGLKLLWIGGGILFFGGLALKFFRARKARLSQV